VETARAHTLFADFPDSARLWVFALARGLTPQEHTLVTGQLDDFVGAWKSHGTPVRGAYHILENRFVLIAGYVDDGVSGCSTDSMVRVMTTLKKEHAIDGFDRGIVFFRDAAGTASAVKREEFQKLVESEAVGDETIVFDPTIQTIGDLRGGRFETTFARAWHATAFGR
jgi:hypothetical protein